MKFAILVAIGPGGQEKERFADFLESLVRYEPLFEQLVVINDGQDPDELRGLLNWAGTRAIVLENPRNGRGWGWAGGLTTGLIVGLNWLASQPKVDFVLKLDTDTLILGPFAQEIASVFAANLGAGIVGSYHSPERRPGDGAVFNPAAYCARGIRKLRAAFSVWRKPSPSIRCSFLGRARRIRLVIERAVALGYAPGEYCPGGGYAFSGDAVELLRRKGFLDDVFLFLHIPITEDLVFAFLARAAGLRLVDGGYNLFRIAIGPLEAPEEILRDDCRIIHPVKWKDLKFEKRFRAWFRAVRDGRTPGPI